MKKNWKIAFGVAAVLVVMVSGQASAVDFTLTVTNTTHGTYFTPLLVTAHAGTIDFFEVGASATAELQAMAEGGDISGLLSLAGGEDADTVANPAAGLLAPGQTVTVSLNTESTGNAYLSIMGMLLPTNDGFVGLDALYIPEESGTYTYYLAGYDAGTEANNELVVDGSGAPNTPGIPAAPGGDAGTGGTGVTASEANTTVHVHRGVLGDADSSGGISDLDSSIHRWLNPVAHLVIEVH